MLCIPYRACRLRQGVAAVLASEGSGDGPSLASLSNVWRKFVITVEQLIERDSLAGVRCHSAHVACDTSLLRV